MKSNPGRWLLLTTKPTAAIAAGLASRINQRRAGHYPALHGCEARSRTVDGEYRVYIRWPAEETL